MRPLSILLCLTYYLPHRTGLTLHAARLALELVARGHAVTVLSARFRGDLPGDETIAGVRFVGLLEDAAELAAFYAACDVLALPGATECFGLVQAEAMMCGTLVVASDIPGARVPVRLTGMGRLVPPGDPAALAAAICSVLREPERFRRPRAEIAETFSLVRTVDRCQAVFAAGAAPARQSP